MILVCASNIKFPTVGCFTVSLQYAVSAVVSCSAAMRLGILFVERRLPQVRRRRPSRRTSEQQWPTGDLASRQLTTAQRENEDTHIRSKHQYSITVDHILKKMSLPKHSGRCFEIQHYGRLHTPGGCPHPSKHISGDTSTCSITVDGILEKMFTAIQRIHLGDTSFTRLEDTSLTPR